MSELKTEFDSRLYNCCENHEAPDWGQFSGFEWNPIVEYCEDGQCWCEPLDDDDEEPSFWSIYGVFKPEYGQGVECITDCQTQEIMWQVLEELKEISGLTEHR